jgi:hypothetical protein
VLRILSLIGFAAVPATLFLDWLKIRAVSENFGSIAGAAGDGWEVFSSTDIALCVIAGIGFALVLASFGWRASLILPVLAVALGIAVVVLAVVAKSSYDPLDRPIERVRVIVEAQTGFLLAIVAGAVAAASALGATLTRSWEDATKMCPACRSRVPAAASVCRHCNHRFDTPAPAT